MCKKQPFNLEEYVNLTRAGPCFICEFIAGNPDYVHHMVCEDSHNIAFLSKYPTLPGYLLVCPKKHVEDFADELSLTAYLDVQVLIHKLSKALKRAFDAERIYILALGSAQGNSHVHFHLAPLPKGVPYEKQQYHALMAENGVLNYSEAEFVELANRIRAALQD